MRPIPTSYAGVRFRSRLEASWAAHFDARHLRWQYEPEGFQLSDGTRYLPDFYLPTARAWAEVKGDHHERMSKVEQFAAELWADSGAATTYDPQSPMVVLFRTPQRESHDNWPPEDHPDWPPYWDTEALSVNVTPLGVMGAGKGYSVAFAKCSTCSAETIVALWQPFCRNCGHIYEDGFESWSESVFDGLRRVPFQFLPGWRAPA